MSLGRAATKLALKNEYQDDPTVQYSPVSALRTHRQPKEDQKHAQTVPFDENVLPTDLMIAYSVLNHNRYIWCPIFRQHLPPAFMETVYFVPPKMEPAPVGYLFGEPEDGRQRINCLGNRLIIAKPVAKLFNDGDFTIVPVRQVTYDENSAPTSVQLKIVLVRTWLADHKIEGLPFLKYSDIHEHILKFKTPFRPGLRYLYFRYVFLIVCFLNITEAKPFVDLWEPRSNELWLRESIIVALGKRIGSWNVYREVFSGSGMFKDDFYDFYHQEFRGRTPKSRLVDNGRIAARLSSDWFANFARPDTDSDERDSHDVPSLAFTETTNR